MRRLRKLLWLYPGVGVKRWVLLLSFGVALCGWGLMLGLRLDWLDEGKFMASRILFALTRHKYVSPHQIGFSLVGLGILLIGWSVHRLNKNLLSVFAPEEQEKVLEILYRRSTVGKGVRVVILGGGTGLATMLRGLKQYTTNITVGVTVTDDGGHSGILRRELDLIPPGDLRNCLVALADAEPVMKDLMQYRFTSGQLKGHNIGNLFIAALAEINQNYMEALRLSSKVLAVRGEVLPSSQEMLRLRATFQDKTTADGETAIVAARKPIADIVLEPKECRPTPALLGALAQAELILLGPGSLYTSVIPHLLIPELKQALIAAQGIKVYICNVMTQPGETDGFTASQHIQVILRYLSPGSLDAALCNTKEPSPEVREKYRKSGQEVVRWDPEEVAQLPVYPLAADFIDEADVVRHDPGKTLSALFKVIARS